MGGSRDKGRSRDGSRDLWVDLEMDGSRDRVDLEMDGSRDLWVDLEMDGSRDL